MARRFSPNSSKTRNSSPRRGCAARGSRPTCLQRLGDERPRPAPQQRPVEVEERSPTTFRPSPPDTTTASRTRASAPRAAARRPRADAGRRRAKRPAGGAGRFEVVRAAGGQPALRPARGAEGGSARLGVMCCSVNSRERASVQQFPAMGAIIAGDGPPPARRPGRHRRARRVLGRRPGAAHRAVERLDPRRPPRAGARRRPRRPHARPAHRGGRGRRRPGPPGAGRARRPGRRRRLGRPRGVGLGPHRDHRHDRPLAHAAPARGDRPRRHPRVARRRRRRHHDLACSPSSTAAGSTSPSSPCPVHDTDIETETLFEEDLVARRAAATTRSHEREPGHARRAGRARAAARAAGHRLPRRPRRARPSALGRARCAPRPRSTACGSGVARLRGLRRRRPPGVGGARAGTPATSARVAVDGVVGRTVGLARRRRGLPSAPARALREVLFDVVAEQAPLQPGHPPSDAPPERRHGTRQYAPRPMPDSHHDHRQPHRRVGRGTRSSTAASTPTEWRKLLPNVWFYDPGFMTTAACSSAITELDGDAGHPALPRLPDRAAGRARRPTSRSPTSCSTASCRRRRSTTRWTPRDHVPHVHPREHAQAVHGGLPLRRPPDGDARVGRRRAVDLLPRRQGHPRRGQPPQADRPAHRQDADDRRLLLPLQRGHAVRVARQHEGLHRELPEDDVRAVGARAVAGPGARPGPRRAVHPPRRPRAELLDDGDAGRRLVARRPVHVDGGGRRRALRPAPRRRQRAGHPHAHRDRLDRQRRRLREEREGGHAAAGSRASATASTRTTTRGRRSSSRPPTRSSPSPARTRCSTSP